MMEAVLSIVVVSFLLIISQLSPGPDVFYVVRTALAQGFRAGVSVAFGITLGFMVQCLVVCWCGTWVMEQEWSRYVLIGAGCWLLYLAWKIFPRHWGGLSDNLEEGAGTHEPLLRLLGSGFLCNILNPKCTLFIMGLMVKPLEMYGDKYAWYTPALVAGFFLANVVGWSTWTGLLQWAPLRRRYVRHSAVVDLVFSVLLAVFAVYLIIG